MDEKKGCWCMILFLLCCCGLRLVGEFGGSAMVVYYYPVTTELKLIVVSGFSSWMDVGWFSL